MFSVTYISLFEILLFLVQTALDDRGTRQQTLLQTSQSLVLDLDGGLFLERVSVVETTLFEDGQQEVVFLLLSSVVLVILLAHLHLVTSLHVDGLLEDADEDVFGCLGRSLLVDGLLTLVSEGDLSLHLLLLRVDLLVAGHLKLVILLLDLLILGLLLVLVVDVVDVGVTDQLIAAPSFLMCRDFTLLVVVEDVDHFHIDVELCLLDLGGSWQIWVKLKLLGHLVDQHLFVVVVFTESQRLLVELLAGREGDTPVDKLVGPALVLLDDLVLFVEELFAQDEAILLSVMVEVELAVAAILADHLLPVIKVLRALIVLDQLEGVREASAHLQLVFTAAVLATDLLCDKTLVVSVESDSASETINLFTVREDLDLTLAVKDGLLSIGAQVEELVLVDKKLG